MGSSPSKEDSSIRCNTKAYHSVTENNKNNQSSYINYIFSHTTQLTTFSTSSNLHNLTPLTSLFHTSVQCDAPPVPPPPPTLSAAREENGTDSSSTSNSTPSPSKPSDTRVMPRSIQNPGPYEQAAMPSKSLTTLDTHDGFRMDIQKQLSPYMVAIHSFWLGTNMLPDGRNKTYSFVTQVADEDGLYMARYDPEKGTVDGRIHKALLGGAVLAKIQMSLSAPPPPKGSDGSENPEATASMGGPPGQNDQCLGEIDFSGLTWTANLKYGSMAGDNIYGLNYYQSITESLAMGGEAMYVAANGNLISSYTAKYEMDAKGGLDEEDSDDFSKRTSDSASPTGKGRASSWFMGQVNPGQGAMNLYYKRVVTPNRVTMGAELQCNGIMESQVTFGAEFSLTRSKVCLAIDGSGRIQTVLETKLGMAPGSPTLNVNADVDHSKDTMRFGYGLNVG